MAFLVYFFFVNIMGQKIINDGVEASTRKSQAHFQIIEALCSANLRVTDKSGVAETSKCGPCSYFQMCSLLLKEPF